MRIFITGIGTDVGKTVAAAIVTQALEADYWKPIQSGDLHHTDTHKVQNMVSNSKTVFHTESYAFTTPASPHYSAALENETIDLKKIKTPKTKNNLVVEGAGGLLVPLNDSQTIANLIDPNDVVIVVSRHYLGSINHTLLTLESLAHRKITIGGIIFNGAENTATESIITSKTKVNVIGRIEDEPYINSHVINEYAEKFLPQLNALLKK